MNMINDGGQAFPVCSVCGAQATIRQGNQKLCDKHYRFGQSEKQRATLSLVELDLRDYFAAKAMQGLLANPGGAIQQNGMSGWGWCNCTVDDVAEFAWHIADAMLRAREASND